LKSEAPNSTPSSTSLPSSNNPNKFWLLGDIITFKATRKDTGGQYTFFEIKVASQNGPPPHYHTNMQEGFYVLDGEFSFLHDNKNMIANVGFFISIPTGVVHTYKNIGKNVGKLLVIGIPSGFENFVEELGIPMMVDDEKSFIPPPPSNLPDIENIIKVSNKNDIIFEPPLK
jgi:quercetin dioxygenase-like cupin family protein